MNDTNAKLTEAFAKELDRCCRKEREQLKTIVIIDDNSEYGISDVDLLLYIVEKKRNEELAQIFTRYVKEGLPENEARSICENKGLMEVITGEYDPEEDRTIEKEYDETIKKLFTEDNKKGAHDLAKALNITYKKNERLMRHGKSDLEEAHVQLLCIVSDFIEERGLPEIIANFVCSEEDFLWLVA